MRIRVKISIAVLVTVLWVGSMVLLSKLAKMTNEDSHKSCCCLGFSRCQ